MARRKALSGTQKFLIVSLSLIAIESAYLLFFSRDTKPVTIREAITKSAAEQPDLTDSRREQLKIQLALADFKAKNKKFPTGLGELIPVYFDVVPVDPKTGKQFKYQVSDNRYLLGDEELRKPGTGAATPSQGGGKIDPAVLASLEGETEQVAFVYNPAGKRDPFQSFDFSQTGVGVDPNNPLTGYDYGQLRLTSVLAGFDEPIAIVENAAGRGFTVRKGSKIGKNGGEIVEIQKDKILILEQAVDFTGEKRTQTVELPLRNIKSSETKPPPPGRS